MTLSIETVFGMFFALVFLEGVHLMNSPRTAVSGNLLGALGMLGAVIVTMTGAGLLSVKVLWISLAIGVLIGYFLAIRVTMLGMPQMVALLNGLGGGASAGTAFVVIGHGNNDSVTLITAALAIIVGGITLSGSVVAALKLARLMPQRPLSFPGQSPLNLVIIMAAIGIVSAISFLPSADIPGIAFLILTGSLLFGALFTIRIGGADMPISISLLNSLSGLAASITGFAVRDPLLIATGAIVGSAGLILTRIMCRAMNRSLPEIILGRTTAMVAVTSPAISAPLHTEMTDSPVPYREDQPVSIEHDPIEKLRNAASVIIVPGYGMALSQAQDRVKALYDYLETMGKDVRFAIHPVAGRMPGHMNVLLAEVDIPYEKLYEMDSINPLFPETDIVIIVGANDVVNPAASTEQGTPIYGMPILDAGAARFIIIFNKDARPGYAGVENPLYTRKNVALFLGDAAEQIDEVMKILNQSDSMGATVTI